MPAAMESQKTLKIAEPLQEYAQHLEPLFPHMEWDLKRSGYTIDTTQYLSVVLYYTVSTFILCCLALVVPVAMVKGVEESYTGLMIAIIIPVIVLFYLLYLPKGKIASRRALIDRDLEYMLKDMQIQLSSRVPLFNTLVNIVRGGYGECSLICEEIIQEVQQGKSMVDVLDNVGMWSPSEYFRRMLWQIVNAMKSGSNVSDALDAIAKDIRMDKENRIKRYAKELNLYALVYLMIAIIMPSMGVTLLVILSSFLGAAFINMQLFVIILAFIGCFQAIFISFVKSKRPVI